MAQYVNLPSLGFAILEAKILKWMKNEGDAVKKNEPMAQMESDKVTYDVVSPIDGVLLKQVHAVGSVVKVDTPLCVVGQKGDSLDNIAQAASAAETAGSDQNSAPPNAPAAPAAPKEEPAPVAAPKAEEKVESVPAPVTTSTGRVPATPAAKALAREKNVDLHLVAGTGPNGTVVKADVENYLKNPAPKAEAALENVASEQAQKGLTEDQIIPFTGIRKTIANSLSQSYLNAVHVTTTVEVDMTDADALRKNLKDAFKEASGCKLSFVPFFVKAAVNGMQEYPILNASIVGENIVVHKNIDFCIAVDTPKGLMVPCLKGSENMGFWEMARKINNIIETSKDGNILPEYFGTGTISLSNAGANGAVTSTPIIANKHGAVVWTGAIIERPVVRNGEICIRKMMNLCVSYDHRIMDGAKVAKFMGIMKKLLENPNMLIVS